MCAAGEVVHVDGFGNLETSIGRLRWLDAVMVELAPDAEGNQVKSFAAASARISLADSAQSPFTGLRHAYNEVEPSALLATISSSGFLEISCNGVSAAERTGARRGDAVELEWE